MAVGIRIQTTSWLTAKLTANPHDNRGPWWTALDGYSPLELRRCGGRCPADQLTRAAVGGAPAAIVSAGNAPAAPAPALTSGLRPIGESQGHRPYKGLHHAGEGRHRRSNAGALVFGFHDQALRLSPDALAAAEIAFLTALSAFIAPLFVGGMRHWRLTFWLILLAFLAGRLCMPAGHLAVHGVLNTSMPTWWWCPRAHWADSARHRTRHDGRYYAVQVSVDHQEQL
jgi:hypothetical protein